jgi:hypothetical protein
MRLTPHLDHIRDPVPILQLFAQRVRTGIDAADGKPVRKRSVEQYLRSVGQAFTGMGAPDPRLDSLGKLDFRLARQLAAYHKHDPAPQRVKPVPISVLHHMHSTIAHTSDTHRAIACLSYLAFFFLLRPGEYCKGSAGTDATPFRLQDVCFYIGERVCPATSATTAEIHAATYVSLTFTTQKNGVKGETIGHGRSGHQTACPVRCLADRVLYLRSYGAPPTTPLAAVVQQNQWRDISSRVITSALRAAVRQMGGPIGLAPMDISARAMRAGGAMALLLGRVDADTIKLIGRWRSDAMLKYLHTSCRPLMQHHAPLMLTHGAYALLPAAHALRQH